MTEELPNKSLSIGASYCEEVKRAHHLVVVYQYDVIEQLNSNSKTYTVCANSITEAKHKAIQKYEEDLKNGS